MFLDNKEDRFQEMLASFIADTEELLAQNPDLEFYAFAINTNIDYGEVLLCLNTEESHAQAIQHYKDTGYYHEGDETNPDIRYNPGEWQFLGYNQDCYILPEQELEEMNDADEANDWENIRREIDDFSTRLFKEFIKSEVFKKIPKTKDFKLSLIDHEEDCIEGLERAELIIKTINK